MVAVLVTALTVFPAAFAQDTLCDCMKGMFCDRLAKNKCTLCDITCGDEGCSGPGSVACINCIRDRYKHPDTGRCEEYVCDTSCDRNHPCSGPLPQHCEVCAPGYYRRPGSSTCTLRPCDNGFYRPSGDTRCRACHKSCASSFGCDGPNDDNCRQCKHGYYRPTGSNACRVMTGCHESCVGCNGPEINQCKACKEGYFKFAGLQPCIECNKGCKGGCTGVTPADCRGCADGYVRLPRIGCVDSTKCWSTCDPVHGCDGPGPDQCRKCKRGYYKPGGEKTCQVLTCDQTCDPYKGCTGPDPIECLACKKGFFRLSLKSKCTACHEMCDIEKGCDGISESNCIACKSGYMRNPSDMKCILSDECHDTCDPTQGCDGPFPEQCIGCREGYHKLFLNQPCVSKMPCTFPDNPCPIETYCAEKNGYTYDCRACDESCVLEKGCDGPLPMQCKVCRAGYIRENETSPCIAKITWRETRSVGKRFIFIVADMDPLIPDATQAYVYAYTRGYMNLKIETRTTQVSVNRARSHFLVVLARSVVLYSLSELSEFVQNKVTWTDLIFEMIGNVDFGLTLLLKKTSKNMGAVALLPVAFWGDKYACFGIKRSQDVYILSEYGGNEIRVECSHFRPGQNITIPFHGVRAIYVDVCKPAHGREHVYIGITLRGKLPFGVITVEKLDHPEAFCEDVEGFIGQDMPLPMKAFGTEFMTVNSKQSSVTSTVVIQALNPNTLVTVYLNSINAVKNITLLKNMDIITVDSKYFKDLPQAPRRITSSLPVQVYFVLRPPCSWDEEGDGDMSHTFVLPEHLFYNEYFVGNNDNVIRVNVTVILVMTAEGRSSISVNHRYIDKDVKWERVIGRTAWSVGEYRLLHFSNILISSHMFGAYVYGLGYKKAFLYTAGFQSCIFGSSAMNPATCEWANMKAGLEVSMLNRDKKAINGESKVSLTWVLWMLSSTIALILK